MTTSNADASDAVPASAPAGAAPAASAALSTHGQSVTLEGMSIVYPNGFTAVQPTDLTIRAGEFFSILGPSGCGKTTILRAVSGFIEPTAGRILIGGQDMRGVGPNARPTALIFQSLALFPLMKVWENVAFGLEARGMGSKERRRRAQALLELVALPDQGDKLPTELSGGQRQRVAVARALAVEPAVLLLDEPLSALDLKLRQHMRAELRAIQQKTGVTFIYITHDQGEALTMSDRIAVMNKGVIEQVGPAEAVYSRPETPFVASFVGETNCFEGRIDQLEGDMAYVATPFGRLFGRNVKGLGQGEKAMVFVRPEQVGVQHDAVSPPYGNQISAAVIRRDLEGPFINVFLEASAENGAAAPKQLAMHLTNSGAARQAAGQAIDGAVRIGFRCEDALVLPEGQLAATGKEMAECA